VEDASVQQHSHKFLREQRVTSRSLQKSGMNLSRKHGLRKQSGDQLGRLLGNLSNKPASSRRSWQVLLSTYSSTACS